MPTSARHLANKTIKKARTYAEAEVERLQGTTELREACEMAKPWLDKVHPADQARLLIALNGYIQWPTPDGAPGQRAFGLNPAPTTPSKPAPTAPTLTPEMTALDWRERSDD